MGTLRGSEIDDWLGEQNLVVTASERAARALQQAFHRRRRAEGLGAWPTPDISDWKNFARNAWEARSLDDRLLLNSTQEQALWVDIIRADQQLPGTIPASLHRLAAMAMEAHSLLCAYAPRQLEERARSGWDQDAGAFSRWLTAFNEVCRKDSLLSPARVPLELIPLLQLQTDERPALKALAFDRVLPVQREVFDAWGQWDQDAPAQPASQVHAYAATDNQTELEACALWCIREVEANAHKRLLVITQDISTRRGEIERAFLRYSKLGARPLFEFSLGVPLSQIPLARAAHLLLRWLDGAIDESELDWLIASGLAASAKESASLQKYMRALRHRNLQRMQWDFDAFTGQGRATEFLPSYWVGRMRDARNRLQRVENKLQSPLGWSQEIPNLLQTIGWPGGRSQGSAEYQAMNRWQQAVDLAGSLGFDGRRIDYQEFLPYLSRALEETLYASQSLDAPIQIAGPAESAGLTADAIWFLGADESAWPSIGSMHPLLPASIQRDTGMPHSSPLRDFELSSVITTRLVSSADTVFFTFAHQKDGVENRPSTLISKIAGTPQPLPANLVPPPGANPSTIFYRDFSRIAFPNESLAGGSKILTFQSQCPFKAFATARLSAESWEPAVIGLTPQQRGQLLHAVLHAIWAGPPHGLGNLDDLLNLDDRHAFVQRHVRQVLAGETPSSIVECMPHRYLQLEEKRLTSVITQWLDYETTRLPFTVAKTEATRNITLAGISLSLRLDRIDRLIDGSHLVIDYKTGNVSPTAWDPPRPDDLQLPLYKIFGNIESIESNRELHDNESAEATGGLVFAKVRAGDTCFTGRVANPVETISPALDGRNGLVRTKLTAAQEADWKSEIERLAADFVAGHAEVNPRKFPDTCDNCGLHAICRIHENNNQSDADSDLPIDEAADE